MRKGEKDIDDYINEDQTAKNFLSNNQHKTLSPNSFKAFVEEYQKKQREAKKSGQKFGGAKFSQRVFTSWIREELKKFNTEAYNSFAVQVDVEVSVANGNVPKKIDFSFKVKNSNGEIIPVVIELKCNIDLVEKDLYKFYLMQNNKKLVVDPKHNKEQITGFIPCMLIWEVEDESKRKKDKNKDSPYIIMLDDAKSESKEKERKKLIVDYFYFAGAGAEEKITRFRKFIQELCSETAVGKYQV